MGAVMESIESQVAFHPVEIDWPRCFRELRANGWTVYRVALSVLAEPPTAYEWAKGESRPGHAYGMAVLMLHRHVCGIEASEKLNNEAKPRG